MRQISVLVAVCLAIVVMFKFIGMAGSVEKPAFSDPVNPELVTEFEKSRSEVIEPEKEDKFIGVGILKIVLAGGAAALTFLNGGRQKQVNEVNNEIKNVEEHGGLDTNSFTT